ncbi:MAG: phosphatase PAP2 family protein [Eubacteriales bacterium]|nr:phosphatase PAP2 family protein [Eubacteriales bacterium]
MKYPALAADYRNFRFQKINEPQYRHLWLLLIWPAYLLRYFLVEQLNPAESYTVIHCPLDDMIPFHEGFVVFYVLWYLAIVGMHLYTMLFDLDVFRRYSKFLIISLTISTAVFLLFPSCQELRPAEFPRDNLLAGIVGVLYAVDTNTNVFPSEHAIGALAVLAAAINTKSLRSPVKIAAFVLLTVLISLSTVFLKQHSILDVLAALPICAVAYGVCYGRRE